MLFNLVEQVLQGGAVLRGEVRSSARSVRALLRLLVFELHILVEDTLARQTEARQGSHRAFQVQTISGPRQDSVIGEEIERHISEPGLREFVCWLQLGVRLSGFLQE